ncbi:MAG: DUF4827 domain-containing protein [Prevotella sp.]|nr:DUF4827 domain-containing protein [Prevotella sp.]
MRKYGIYVLMLVTAVLWTSCSDTETYAEQKDKERSAINQYIVDEGINVISEQTFIANGYQTNVASNEYVLFGNTGVYMQIVRTGCGEKLKSGETATVLCRFDEYNIMTDSLILSNRVLTYSSQVDKMTVKNTSGTFKASFVKGASLMYARYQSAAVPSGWLVPLSYIKIGRPESENDEIARVKLIVPHTQGQQYAAESVYPCFYDISYERGR